MYIFVDDLILYSYFDLMIFTRVTALFVNTGFLYLDFPFVNWIFLLFMSSEFNEDDPLAGLLSDEEDSSSAAKPSKGKPSFKKQVSIEDSAQDLENGMIY